MLNGKTIAFLESRLADQVAALITRRGAIALSAPALSEEPDLDPEAIRRLIENWAAQPIKLAIFQTGVGTRALFAATDALGLTTRLLELLQQTRVAVRGPKPTAALRGRGVHIHFSAEEPFTTTELLRSIETVELTNASVMVQRYGDANVALEQALEARGAAVIDVPTYRWALPRDTQPLCALIDALALSQVDAVVFTSAAQVKNLFAVARRHGKDEGIRRDLSATCVVSIGPVCSAALVAHGVPVRIEAHPPKLGPLLAALEAAFDG